MHRHEHTILERAEQIEVRYRIRVAVIEALSVLLRCYVDMVMASPFATFTAAPAQAKRIEFSVP